MIDEAEFLKYKLETERRFFELEKQLLLLQHRVEKNELAKTGAVAELSEEEKTKIEEDAVKQTKTFAEWTEDAETLAKLGIGVKTNE